MRRAIPIVIAGAAGAFTVWILTVLGLERAEAMQWTVILAIGLLAYDNGLRLDKVQWLVRGTLVQLQNLVKVLEIRIPEEGEDDEVH